MCLPAPASSSSSAGTARFAHSRTQTYTAKPAPCGTAPTPKDLQSWACTACSLQNSHLDVDSCGVCHSPRIPVAKPRAEGLHSNCAHVMAIALNFSRHKTKRCKIFISPRIHQWTLSSFVLAFLKRRLGGGASVAALATRIALYDGSRCVSAARRRAINDLILRRVFGGVGADTIARSARAELSRMVHEGPPVCSEHLMELQVRSTCVCVRG